MRRLFPVRDDRRPDPEALLARAARESARERRGELKIYFGASPGVGKTYAMLEAAQARRRRGEDVVVGWIEPHGRADTERLLAGLEVVPPRVVEHRGITLREMDLDAVLARRPALVLVDELAHTNAPGSRHGHRWRDVEELLDAGIDVHSTLNVQHVESLRDVVAGITGVVVGETVPDSVLDRADEIELVDLPPAELLQRLKDGKIYVPAQAERAMERFFAKGNLIALRELALRRTAERVDVQGDEWRRDQGIERPWAARERVLVAVSPSPQSADLVRSAARMAARMKAPFLALSVETPASDGLGEADRARVSAHLALAERLGGETLVVRGERVGDEILAVARARDVTRIVVGTPGPRRPFARRGSDLVDWLVRRAQGIDVLVTRGESGPRPAPVRPPAPPSSPPTHHLIALALVAAASGLCLVTRPWLSIADQAMIHLVAVIVAASRLHRAASISAAVAAVAALDFFFVPPFYTFAVSDVRHVVTFGVLLATSLLVSRFAARLRGHADAARERERRTAALYAMSRDLTGSRDVAAIAAIGARHVADLLAVEVAAYLRAEGGAEAGDGLRVAAGAGTAIASSEKERVVARWVLENGRAAGCGTETLPASEGLYVPLVSSGRTLGVFGAAVGGRAAPPTASERQLIETFAAQTAVALERAELAAEAERARVTVETERMRSTLLSTVSHDLRTPLASITGAAGAMLEPGTGIDEATRRELLTTIRDESDRLGRLVSDLLELTRLEGGGLAVRREWYPLEEVVASAVQRVRPRLASRAVTLDVPREVLLAEVDGVLLEQVVVNLLENAAKHTPAGTPIDVRLSSTADEVEFEVSDRGPGIPPGEEDRIFEKFHRIEVAEPVEGAGLGLAVCRAIVRAHDGRIRVENRPGGGATFRVTLPRGKGDLPIPHETEEAEGPDRVDDPSPGADSA